MRENENKISRFDFPVFYAVLTYGMFLKNKTQEKVCALLFVGGTPDSGRYFSKKEYTGVEESDWLTFEKKAVSGHVRGERFYESYYKHLQMLFNAWEKPEGTALGKAEVKWRLEEIFKGTEPQAVMNVATNMLKVLDNCEIKNIQKTKENIYSEDKNYIQRKENDEKVFKERKAIYLSIKTKVREYYDNSKWLDSLAEAFRLAFVFTDNVDGKRFIKYSSEDFSKLKAILESVLNSFTGFKTWEDNTSIRKKLQHGCKNSCAALPKQTLLLIPIYLSSGRKSSEYSDTENAEFLPTFLRKRISQAKALPFDEVVKDYTERFCLLLGPGGAGKTTALSNFMKDYVANIQDNTHETNGTLLKDMIPVYLDLSAAPDTNCFLYREGKSTFIRRAVYHYMHSNEDKGSLPALNDWYPWDDTSEEEAFNDESNLLLLLDGLNEVSRTVLDNGKYTDKSIFQMICEEIKYLVWKNKCRKIVLISRTADGFLFTSDESVSPVLYDFCELDDTTIQETLGKYAGFFTEESQKEIDRVMGNPTLCETLRRPLFLSMYCHLKGTDASTSGELLRIFFHERKDALYTIQERNAQIEKVQRSKFGDALKNTLTAEQQAFILDFILPAFAWNMGERFWINTAEADTVIQAVLEDKSETSVRGYAGIRAFTKYQNQNDSFRKTRYTAETLKNLGFKSSGEFESYTMVERITEYCVSLGVLELDSNTQRLRFTQQIYRDYFVCAYVTNTFRIAEAEYEMAQESSNENQKDKAFECLCSLLGEKPLVPVVRHMIGESLGEHRNGPYYGDDKKWHYYTERNIESSLRGLTEKMLDICRGRYGEKLGFTVFNLLNIIADVRPNRDLSGINLNGLDLRKYNLIGTRFAHPDLYATFVDSRINLYPNCREDINHMVFNAKCSHFLTYGESGRLYIWDVKTLICTDSISAHNGKIYDLKFSSDSNFFYTIGEDNLIKEWSVADYTCVRQTELASETIRYAVLLCHPLNEKVYIFTSNIKRERSWIDVYI